MAYLATSTKLFATKQLDGFGKSISNSMDRLSSGMRINKISDDAAGVAQDIGLNLNNKLANRGISNLQDGVSAMNIADSALGEMSNVLSRIQELAQQAANGTYTNNQRAVLHTEANSLASEYNRIVQTTEFNGTQLLTGSGTGINYKAGFDQVGSIRSQIGGNITSDAYGIYSTGTTSLVSVATDGTQGNAAALNGAVDSSGRIITFTSTATNLISGVSGEQAYAKDTMTGELRLISSTSSGVASNGTANFSRAISEDGKFAAFTSNATNLVSGVTGTQMYLKNLETNEVTVVSTNLSGDPANATISAGGGMSSDNRYIGFMTTATNLISGVTGLQHYVKDLSTGEVLLTSSDSSGNPANGSLISSGVNFDGNVYFISTANNLVSGVSGQQAYFKNHSTGSTTLVSSDASGVMSNGTTSTANATADNRYVVFSSDATNLVSGVTGEQIYKKDMLTGEVEVISTNESGQVGNGSSLNSRITADGRYLMFRSNSTNLIDGVTGDQFYRKDLETGRVDLISRSTNGEAASGGIIGSFIRYSENGRKVFFASTSTNLVSGDSNGFTDIFMRDMSEAGVQKLAGIVLTNRASAITTSELIQGYTEEINLAKAQIGATTSRFEFANSHLHSLSSNFADASSKIMSVDVAEEAASLVSNQIKQQAAMAVLAHNSKSYDLNLLSL